MGEDLYILGHDGLKYVSKVGMGLPAFLGDSFQSIPGREIPIYYDHQNAQESLNQNPNDFYRPKKESGDYEWHSNLKNDIYLYFDDQGYVRWLKYQEKKDI